MLKNYKLLKILDNLAIDNPEELIQKLWKNIGFFITITNQIIKLQYTTKEAVF